MAVNTQRQARLLDGLKFNDKRYLKRGIEVDITDDYVKFNTSNPFRLSSDGTTFRVEIYRNGGWEECINASPD